MSTALLVCPSKLLREVLLAALFASRRAQKKVMDNKTIWIESRLGRAVNSTILVVTH